MKYEYKQLWLNRLGSPDHLKEMETLGNQGWELVIITPESVSSMPYAFFKRVVEPTPTEEKCVGFSLDKNVKVCACPCHSKAPKEQMVPKKLGILPLDGSAVYVLENKVNDIIDYLS